jgi:hypothetical protein
MLTVSDQQPTSEQPVLRQADLLIEMTPADSAPQLSLSLLLSDSLTRRNSGE